MASWRVRAGESLAAGEQRAKQAGLIACGFTNNVDHVVAVDGDAIGELARGFGIGSDEPAVATIDSPRACIAAVVDWIAAGRGGDIPATDEATLRWLVDRFPGRLQVGGTGAQAARTLARLGFRALVHLTSLSPVQAAVLDLDDRLLVATVTGLRPLRETVRAGDPTMYHVVFEYQAGCRVPLGDGVVMAPCDNRIMVSYDPINRAWPIAAEFAAAVADEGSRVDAVLISGFCQITDHRVFGERAAETLAAIARWRRSGRDNLIHLEAGSAPDDWLLTETLSRLGPTVDSVGLNQEELALALGTTASELGDIAEIVTCLRNMRHNLSLPRLGLHTRNYCLTITRRDPTTERQALLFASLVGGARARLAEFPTMDDLRRLVTDLQPSSSGLVAERQLITALNLRDGIARLGAGAWLVFTPAFAVERPAATVGLGDSFTAGLLAMLSGTRPVPGTGRTGLL